MKKVREGYKMTELGEIPVEWAVKTIQDICIKITDGEHINPKIYSEGIPLVSAKDLKERSIDFSNVKFISKEDYNKFSEKCDPEIGDVLIVSRGATIGRSISLKVGRRFALMGSVLLVKLNSSKFNGNFLTNYLRLSNVQKRILATSGSSAQQAIYIRDISKLKVLWLKIEEQKKISLILTLIDEKIENTDNLIEKTKELKKGLMQKLLTKGIGHDRFKNTEIGRIPEKWEVVGIKDVADTTSGGTPNRGNKEYYKNGIIPWVKTGELNNKYIFGAEEKITEKAVLNSSAKLVPINSVLVAMYGATIGKTSISKNILATNQACCAVICKQEVLDNEFLFYILNFKKNALIELGAGGAQPNISQTIVRNFKIVVPTIEEQEKIALILSFTDKKIDQYESKKEKLQELKKGLMQKLLTGKIRVKI